MSRIAANQSSSRYSQSSARLSAAHPARASMRWRALFASLHGAPRSLSPDAPAAGRVSADGALTRADLEEVVVSSLLMAKTGQAAYHKRQLRAFSPAKWAKTCGFQPDKLNRMQQRYRRC